MRRTIVVKEEVEVAFIRVILPVDYEDEDMPFDYPYRDGNTWEVRIEADTGMIIDWPDGITPLNLHMMVRDGGTYILEDPDLRELSRIEENYVPNDIPGSYGDYIEFQINEFGKITNWPKPLKMSFKQFPGFKLPEDGDE